MAETIAAHAQQLAQAAKIELYTVDTSIYGGPVYRFVNETRTETASEMTWNGEVLAWNGIALTWMRSIYLGFGGIEYLPLPIRSEGWQRSGRGTLPRPTLTVSNITGVFSALNLLYDDLLGVAVTRVRTFAWALDGEPDADPNAILHPIDQFVIARKTAEDNRVCTYELAAAMDLEGRVFPGRPMTQNFCLHRYRVWNAAAEAFHYTAATCPYTGPVHRDTLGVVVTPALDRCAKTLPECVARFGGATDLGFSGFPGIDRVRT